MSSKDDRRTNAQRVLMRAPDFCIVCEFPLCEECIKCKTTNCPMNACEHDLPLKIDTD